MPLSVGTRLGPYEIVAPIGAGGMGEVFRARDTKLNRDVALKILSDAFANDPDRLARFTREAQTLAALNHPHIAHIYGLDEAPNPEPRIQNPSAVRFLVMELVEGEDLARRIARGPIPLDEALPIAKQIADALEAAHEQGIIHRDLKPANIKVRPDGTVKVLDFGLAKALEGPGGSGRSGGLSQSPTLTTPAMTAAGIILGTAAYMAPEQAKGKAVDKRADIWAFGVVLYEMLTGRTLFGADSIAETIGHVVSREPDWAVLPAMTPSSVRHILRRCLAKDPRERLHDIADARIELQDPPRSVIDAVAAPASRSLPRAVALFATGAVAAGVLVYLGVRTTPASAPVRRFAVSGLTPLVVDAYQTLTLSPDGRSLAFRGRGPDGTERIFVRALDSLQLKALPDTNGAKEPFFSADGQSIGFFVGDTLRRISITGGSSRTIVSKVGGATGGTWMDDGSIVFVGDGDIGVQRVASAGGTPERLFSVDRSAGQSTVAAPWGLPGSRGVLLSVRQADRFDVSVLSLKDRTLHRLVEDAYSPVWSSTGHVLFHQGSSILALPFDSQRLVATGSAFPLSEITPRISYQTRLFAVASDGTLVYVPPAPAGEGEWAAVWVDRGGRETPISTFDRAADTPRLSPDGRRIAFRTPAPNCDVWVRDLARGTNTRVTHHGDNHGVAWTSDGLRVTVARKRGDATDIVALPGDGSGPDETIASFPGDGAIPLAWLSRGDALLVEHTGTQTGEDISLVSGRGAPPKILIDSAYDDMGAAFSPDGRYIVYVSNESGRPEVYVRPYMAPGPRIQISADGGVEPVWSRSGSELFFRQGRDVLTAAIRTAPEFSAQRPVVVFSGDYAFGPLSANYDVSADGARFLMMKGRQWIEGQVIVVLNWFAEWKPPASGAAR